MGFEYVLVDFGAPAGAGRYHEVAVLDDGRMGQELWFPWHLIHVILRYPQVRDDGGKMRADDGRERAAEIVRCDVYLIGVAHRRHADRLRNTVILRIHDGDVGAVGVEIGS